MTEQYNVIETANDQFTSLLKFAGLAGFKFNGRSFVRKSKNKLLESVSVVSFNTMVSIYSTKKHFAFNFVKFGLLGKYAFFITNPNSFDREEEPGFEAYNLIPFYVEDLEKAYSQKDFESVKLQMNRKGEVLCSNHMVKFLDRDQAQEFANSTKEA